ncbi:MFS transporter [Candidatus Saccharibacteria bacterium]|nr:MAG: MFS transporter [Candidatus Saccharibacteria bacterium]
MAMGLGALGRLRLIYFCFGLMFWYGIEQLFLDNILQDPSARAVVTTVWAVTFLLSDIPSGIIADRIGRKRALITASLFQLLLLCILAISPSLLVYGIGAAFYALYTAFQNGAFQAFLYDHLLSEGRERRYARYMGQASALFLLGAGVANALSGIIAEYSNLRVPYLLSILPALVALATIMTLREPSRHKESELSGWRAHAKDIITVIASRPIIWVLGLIFFAANAFWLTVGEFGQVYILSFGVSAAVLGLLWALTALISGLAQFTSHWVKNRIAHISFVFIIFLVAFALIQSWVGIGLFIVIYAITGLLETIADAAIQHHTPSKVRASVFSTVSFAANAAAIPLIWWFNSIFSRPGYHSGKCGYVVAHHGRCTHEPYRIQASAAFVAE